MQIPPPNYILEQVTGIVWKKENEVSLTLSPFKVPDDAELIREGVIFLRYGLQVLQSPQVIVPGLFISEKGAPLTGQEAWQFMMARFQLHPRADVIGFYSDGQKAELMMRDIDFGDSVKVLAYADRESRQPLAWIDRLEAPPDAELPEFLSQFLTRHSVA